MIEREKIEFAMGIIIRNPNLSAEGVKKKLRKYVNYLESEAYVNPETRKVLQNMENKAEDLVNVAKVSDITGLTDLLVKNYTRNYISQEDKTYANTSQTVTYRGCGSSGCGSSVTRSSYETETYDEPVQVSSGCGGGRRLGGGC